MSRILFQAKRLKNWIWIAKFNWIIILSSHPIDWICMLDKATGSVQFSFTPTDETYSHVWMIAEFFHGILILAGVSRCSIHIILMKIQWLGVDNQLHFILFTPPYPQIFFQVAFQYYFSISFFFFWIEFFCFTVLQRPKSFYHQLQRKWKHLLTKPPRRKIIL